MDYSIIIILAVAVIIIWKYSEQFYIRFRGGHFERLNVAELKQYMKTNKPNKDFLLIDVRTEPELKLGKIGGSINIELKQLKPDDMRLQSYKDRPVVIYCESGSRSKKAATLLAKNRFSKVYYLAGGYQVWRGDASL